MRKKTINNIKKIFLIMLLAIIGLSSKTMGQGTCQTAVLISPTDSIKRNEIPITDTVYWVKFIATDTSINFGMQNLISDTGFVNQMTLFYAPNNCNNYFQIAYKTGISLHYGNLVIGNTYLLKVKNNGRSIKKSFLTFYKGNNKAKSLPISNLINITANQTLCVGTTLIFNPQIDLYTTSYNFFTWEKFIEVNYYPWLLGVEIDCAFPTYWIHIYAENSSGSSFTTYNGNVTLQPQFTTTTYCLSPTFTASTCITNPNYISNCTYQWNYGDGNQSAVSTSPVSNHVYSLQGTYNVTLSVTFNSSRPGCTNTSTIVNPVTVNPLSQINKPIITGNANNCTIITNYSVSNPQNCVIYNWVISPQNAGSILAGDGTANITVEWKDLTDCENTLTVTASSPGVSSISSVINIYKCCKLGIISLNNVSNLTTSFANQSIDINGDLHITGNVTFDNCGILLSPYAKIIVEPGANLNIINGTTLTTNRCCDIMWDGIYLSSSNSTLTANSPSGGSVYTTIENSINGIVATNNANLNIVGVWFNKNASSMSIKNYLPLISNIAISFNHFEGGPLKKPYLGGYSRYGIQIDNADNIPIGNSTTGGAGNYFNNLFCGIYGLNSYIKIYSNHFTNINDYSTVPYQCQSLTNPLLICKPTAIHSGHSLSTNLTPKKVEIGYTNTFDNCVNGIKVYNEKAIISSNIVRAVTNAIDVLDPLNYSVINNNIVENCSNGTYPYMGIRVWKTQPGLINLSVYSNSVKSRYTGIFVGNCKSQRLSNMKAFYVDINNNTVKITNDAIKGLAVQNCPSVFVKCNNIDKNTTTALTGMKHGISVESTLNGEIQQNHVKFMGAGINVYGCSDLTQFYCNTLESDYYGFLFNQHASITNQGTEKIRTDNQWTPSANYSGYYQYQPVERKLWKLNDNLSNGIKWYVYNTSYSYHPENYSPNPTQNRIFPYIADNDATTTCNQNCPPSSIKEMTLEEREEKFGAIVRDELEYPDLNVQFREYNRYVLYQTLKENTWMMTMGGADDYMYQDFFNNESNGNLGKFDALETLIAEGNIDQALVKNGQIIDSTLIAYNQRVVNDIYLNTFARDSYELTPAQYQTLYDIATNYTAWEGGEGVYIARYMLGIDIDYSNPNVQFSKGDGGIAETEMLSVFPNPASNNITLSFANAIEGGFVVDVYNHTGAKVLTETISQTQAQYQLNTAKLKNGIYFISVRTNTETFKSKFTIIK